MDDGRACFASGDDRVAFLDHARARRHGQAQCTVIDLGRARETGLSAGVEVAGGALRGRAAAKSGSPGRGQREAEQFLRCTR